MHNLSHTKYYIIMSSNFLSFLVVFLAMPWKTIAWSPRRLLLYRPVFPTEKMTDSNEDETHSMSQLFPTRRRALSTLAGFGSAVSFSNVMGGSSSRALALALAATVDAEEMSIEVTPSSSDARKFFNEGRALESQGNMAAAQRLYAKVTQISPTFIYGWSNLANTQVAMGDLMVADDNYSKAIQLCETSNQEADQGFGVKKCNDLYVLYLNRGSVRLNNNRPNDSLQDLQTASILRGRPDAIIAQNLARAKELNGFYGQADKDYSMAISMTANEVNPFWLRSAMVKLQLGDGKAGDDLLKRVENRFPEAPEVKAASATFLLLQQKDEIAARRKFLEIPNKQRLRFSDNNYLSQVVAWPPVMVDGVTALAKAVGDV
jgi:tetratricopeptide (TPR) repeat protein